MSIKEITHPILGRLTEARAPDEQVIAPDDDWDLALYAGEDETAWVVKLELDYESKVLGTVYLEKEFAVKTAMLHAMGRGPFIAEFEKVYDTVCENQMPFVSIEKRIEVRNAIMELLTTHFERLDNGG